MRRSRATRSVALVLLALVAGCATRVAPPLPVTLAYPEFIYPKLPQPLATADATDRIERGWRFLQKRRSRERGTANSPRHCSGPLRCIPPRPVAPTWRWPAETTIAPSVRSMTCFARRRCMCRRSWAAGRRCWRSTGTPPPSRRSKRCWLWIPLWLPCVEG